MKSTSLFLPGRWFWQGRGALLLSGSWARLAVAQEDLRRSTFAIEAECERFSRMSNTEG